MEIEKLKNLPKSFLKEAMGFLFKIEKLRKIKNISGISFNEAEKKLTEKIDNYRRVEREALRTWKIVELSRNENRPQTSDYIKSIFKNFIAVSGDRLSHEDSSIIAGFGKLKGKTVAVIGHNKGKDLKQKIDFNFGSSMPQGYRKAVRVMDIAEKFGFPLITFIDTPGAYPALEAEDQGQAGAISNCILRMFELNVPVITVLIGEGGSGGALALAVGNYILMLENSTYSVISPEGCASILWRDSSVAKLAARALKLTSRDLFKLGVVDKIIYEPLGGAQNNPERMVKIVKGYVISILMRYLRSHNTDFRKNRAEKYESIGFFIDR
jgi:acetyl-CoA carboxylase carboxyl transferase subunit alpha